MASSVSALKDPRRKHLLANPAPTHNVSPPWSKESEPKESKTENSPDIAIKNQVIYNNDRIDIQLANTSPHQFNLSNNNNSNSRRSSTTDKIAQIRSDIETLCTQLFSCESSEQKTIILELNRKNDVLARLQKAEQEPSIPPGIPFVIQWRGRIFNEDEKIFDTLSDSIKHFEDIVENHNMDIERYWRDLLPMCLKGDLLAFYEKTIQTKSQSNISWSDISKIIQDKYDVSDIQIRTEALKKLIALRLRKEEPFSMLVLRFREYVENAQIEDKFLQTFYFMEAIRPLRIYENVAIVLGNKSSECQTDIDHIISLASGFDAVYCSRKERESSKTYCKYHPQHRSQHNTEECRTFRLIAASNSSQARKRIRRREH